MNLSQARKLQGEELERLVGLEVEARTLIPDESALVHRVVGGSLICRSQQLQGREYRIDPEQLTAVRDPERARQRAAERQRRVDAQREQDERRRAEKRARQKTKAEAEPKAKEEPERRQEADSAG